MLEKKNFHVFRKDDRHFLFLTLPVALFSIDAETYGVLRKVEVAQTLDGDGEATRWEELNQFADRYMERAKPARSVRSPEDITDKVIGAYL